MFVPTITPHQVRVQVQLRAFAQTMRQHPTPAEAVVWKLLRKRQICHLHFRRQHPLFSYIVDFYCHQYKLIIEIDGPIHRFQLVHDQVRDHFFTRFGYTILRISNDEVLTQPHTVLRRIMHILTQCSQTPQSSSPTLGEEEAKEERGITSGD